MENVVRDFLVIIFRLTQNPKATSSEDPMRREDLSRGKLVSKPGIISVAVPLLAK